MTTLLFTAVDSWSSVLQQLRTFGQTALDQGLTLLFAAAIVFAGWALARLAGALVRRVLRWVRFDDGVRHLLGARAVARHEPARLAAWAVHWAVLGGALLLALDAIGFDLGASVAQRLEEVTPRIVTAAVLFVIGSLLALVIGAIAHRFLETADVPAARLFGQVVTGVLVGFSALLGLEQLGFAAQFVMAVGLIAVGTAGLAFALAFGLGCRDLLRDFIVEYLRALDDRGPRRPE